MMIEISDGILPPSVLNDRIDTMWNNLLQQAPIKSLPERSFINLFTNLDILELATIVM